MEGEATRHDSWNSADFSEEGRRLERELDSLTTKSVLGFKKLPKAPHGLANELPPGTPFFIKEGQQSSGEFLKGHPFGSCMAGNGPGG